MGINLSPANLQTREVIPMRELYLGVERGLGTAFQAMRYFISPILPRAPLATQIAAARPAGLPATNASETQIPASLPKANLTAPGTVLAAQNRPIDSSDGYLFRATGAGSIQRR